MEMYVWSMTIYSFVYSLTPVDTEGRGVGGYVEYGGYECMTTRRSPLREWVSL